MADRSKRKSGRAAPGILALGSAAVLAVYTAGYSRTRATAHHLDDLAEAHAQVARATAAQIVPAAAPSLPAARVTDAKAKPARKPQTTASAVPPPASPAPVAPTEAATAPAAPAPVADPQPAPPADTAASTPPAAMPTTAHTAAPAAPLLKDGTYTGWGSSRHGDIQAEVVIDQGKIVSARIAQCWTRYPCSWISALPAQVVNRQSANVDYISGATQSTDAFYYAIVQALTQAKNQ